MLDWEIRQDEAGAWHAGAGNGAPGMSVDSPGTLVKRRAINSAGGEFACWLVGEIDGVKTYVAQRDGRMHILMTREDLYPSMGGGAVSQSQTNGAA